MDKSNEKDGPSQSNSVGLSSPGKESIRNSKSVLAEKYWAENFAATHIFSPEKKDVEREKIMYKEYIKH